MKHFLTIVALLYVQSVIIAQNHSEHFNNWNTAILKVVEFEKLQNTDSLKHYLDKSYQLSKNYLPQHPAYVFSISEKLSHPDLFSTTDFTKQLIEQLINRTEVVYGQDHEFYSIIKNKLLDTNGLNKEKLKVADIYFSELDAYFETSKKEDTKNLPAALDLMLSSYIWGNYGNVAHYGYYVSLLDASVFEDYYLEYFHGNRIAGFEFYNTKNLKYAIVLLENAYGVMVDQPSLDDRFGLDIRESLINAHMQLEQYEDAVAFSDVEDLFVKKYGANTDELAYIKNQLAICYDRINEVQLATLEYSSALLIYQINGNIKRPDYAIIRNNYIDFLKRQNNAEALLEFYDDELAAYSRNAIENDNYLVLLKEYETLAKYLERLSNVTRLLGLQIDYAKSKNAFNTSYIESVFRLAELYSTNDNYKASYNLLNDESEHLFTALNNTDYDKAQFYNTLVTNSIGYKPSSEKEATLKNTSLLDYTSKSIAAYEAKAAPYSEYASLITTKAVLLFSAGQPEEGLELFRTHKENFINSGNTQSEDFAGLLILGATYASNKELNDEALELAEDGLEIFERLKKQGTITNISNYYTALETVAQLNVKNNNFNNVADHYLELYDYTIKSLEKEVTLKSNASKEFKISASTARIFSHLQYVNLLLNGEDQTLLKVASEAAMMSKNLTLNVSGNILNSLRSVENPLLNDYIESYNKIAYQSNYIIDLQYLLNTESAIAEAKNYQKEMDTSYNELIKEFLSNAKQTLIKPLKNEQIRLNGNEAFIDFSRIENFDNEPLYIAYLHLPEAILPKLINIGKESKLIELLNNGTIKDLSYISRGAKGTSNTTSLGKELYDFLWAPIDEFASDKSSIFFALTGRLSNIPFVTLQNEKGEMLLDRFNLEQLSNASYFINRKEIKPNFSDVLLYGGIDYDLPQQGQLKQTFDYLPGTKTEIENIKDILPEAKIVSGRDATENTFRALSGRSPSVLHLATHGFYFNHEKITLNDFGTILKQSKDPLKRTGLLLTNGNAGLNAVLTDEFSSGANGVLTSFEIAFMDLRATDLVVLSACETGLGDIEGAEGTYGLQRAFKMAGANVLLMSLWEIPDKETQEFMTHFYKNCKVSGDIKESFRATQKHMRTLYKDQPEKWSAFILVE